MKKKKNFMPIFIMIQLVILGTCYYLLDKSPQNPQPLIIIMIIATATLLMLGVTQLCFMNFKTWKKNAEKEAVLKFLKDKN